MPFAIVVCTIFPTTFLEIAVYNSALYKADRLLAVREGRPFWVGITRLKNPIVDPHCRSLSRPLRQDKTYRKIREISPGAYIFQRLFSRGLFLEGLMYGGKFAFQNRLGWPYSWKEICRFSLFTLYLRAISKYKPPERLILGGAF